MTKFIFACSIGGAKLEYTCMTFANNSNIVASYSGVPDFKLTIW